MKYILEIKPSIDVTHRHRLQNVLELLGYHVIGGGQSMDWSFCDISFEDVEDFHEWKPFIEK